MSRMNVLALVVVAALLAAAIAGLVARNQRLPTGVVPITWDKEACAHCRMLLSEPAFAVQLQLEDGRVLNFDDPGCYFAFLPESGSPVHAAWLHHVREERWLKVEDAAFESGLTTPMGFGFGAVDRGTTGALGMEEVNRRVLESAASRGGGST